MITVKKYGASWCHQCLQQDKEFKKNPLLVEFESIDIDDLPEETIEDLKLKSVPVTMVFVDGEESKRWVGTTPTKEINEYIKSLE